MGFFWDHVDLTKMHYDGKMYCHLGNGQHQTITQIAGNYKEFVFLEFSIGVAIIEVLKTYS